MTAPTAPHTLIHINEALEPTARSTLEESLRAVPGVIAPGFSEDHEHLLLLVVYNPEEIGAQALLGKVQEYGYDAALIGL